MTLKVSDNASVIFDNARPIFLNDSKIDATNSGSISFLGNNTITMPKTININSGSQLTITSPATFTNSIVKANGLK